MISSHQQKDRIILFIPFSHKEKNNPLVANALDWQKNARITNKNVPEIVIYCDKRETGDEYDFPMHKQFSEEVIPFGTTIYMLAHGTNDPRWVANRSNLDDDLYQLPIELAAKRAKEIGFTPSLISNIKVFKLYTCEESTQPEQPSTNFLASHFAKELGEEYDNLLLIYYSAIVYIPLQFLLDKTIKKRAITASSYNEIKSVMNTQTINEMSEQNKEVLADIIRKKFVSPRKYQNIVSVKDARNNVAIQPDSDAKWCMMTNKARSIQYQVFNSIFKSFLQQLQKRKAKTNNQQRTRKRKAEENNQQQKRERIENAPNLQPKL